MLTDLKPAEFWEMTLPEWYIYSECYAKKQIEIMDFEKSIAWFNARLGRAKKIPELSEFISKKPQQEEEQISALDNVFNRFKAQNGG
jgi:ferritin-like metal-binding protein YciE